MPLYDYECLNCGHVFELRQSFNADPEGVCPQCAGMSRRKFHAVPIIYKGSGFYTTDYKKTGYSGVPKEDEDKKGTEETATATAGSENNKGKSEAATATAGGSESKKEAAKEA